MACTLTGDWRNLLLSSVQTVHLCSLGNAQDLPPGYIDFFKALKLLA